MKYSVLIVEDDSAVSELIVDFFQNAGFAIKQIYIWSRSENYA